MIIKGIVDEDFVNFKECSMFIAFPTCTWKCGHNLCQNSVLATSPNIEITTKDLVKRFIDNPLTSAVVCGGLEPMDSFIDLIDFITILRQYGEYPVVIYTGYNHDEICKQIEQLADQFSNIIVKFGRYLPDCPSHFDKVLGVNLQSDNQYGEVIS